MAAANVGWGVTSEHTISDCGMKDDTAFGTIFGIYGAVGLGRKKNRFAHRLEALARVLL